MSAARLRWAEVDVRALAHNVAQIRSRLDASTAMMAVVKADGYGHGAVRVAKTALDAGAGWLAVATIDEAEDLRRAQIDGPVLVLGPVAPGGEASALATGVSLSVHGHEGVSGLSQAAAGRAAPARVHLKVDTGMGRLGCSPEAAVRLARRIEDDPGLELEGLWTHFAEADDAGSPRTQEQLRTFLGVVTALASAGVTPPILHCANSAAALQFPSSHLAMVRIGLPMYGYHSTAAAVAGLDLRPALAWKSTVVALHDLGEGDRVGYGGTYRAPGPRRSATVSTGYADGFPRSLSDRGEVLVRGMRARLMGRVSMDYFTADVTNIEGVVVGDEVVLI
ncbi:MAG: alanine racemase, partial [Candidatus Dormibacteria bacterium]